ncbi:Uncharacterized protein HZ326_18471 [Fusarium oxysporum f. sp. albedinis]|nr:Uncharacterized protein HZ326_18471 [Fusarium oxysporum f. sp. albedinis]
MGACPFPATPHTNTMTSGPLGHSYWISFSEHAPQPFITQALFPVSLPMVPLPQSSLTLVTGMFSHCSAYAIWGILHSTAIQTLVGYCPVLKPSSRKVSCQCSFTSSCMSNGIVYCPLHISRHPVPGRVWGSDGP